MSFKKSFTLCIKAGTLHNLKFAVVRFAVFKEVGIDFIALQTEHFVASEAENFAM
jgi:hypothetical protein